VSQADRLNSVLEEVMRAGARIVSLNPIRPSLEAFFERN
jgi:hypothetical protein